MGAGFSANPAPHNGGDPLKTFEIAGVQRNHSTRVARRGASVAQSGVVAVSVSDGVAIAICRMVAISIGHMMAITV